MNIDVDWGNRGLAKACSSDAAGSRRFGAENWRLLRRRLASLLGAPTLADLDDAPGRCHALGADRSGQFALALWGPYRLILVPSPPVPLLPDGGIDRRAVTAVRIVEIVNYHD
jgi:hypothetical protein